MLRVRFDLPSAFAELASSRAAGTPGTPEQYSDLLLACVETNRALAVYRLYEEALQDSVRFDTLSQAAKKALRGRIPPDAEQIGRVAHEGHSLAATPVLERTILHDQPPRIWVAPQKKVALFDGSSAEGLARAWEAIKRREAPVHIRNVGCQWPALRSWNLNLLGSTLGRGMVNVHAHAHMLPPRLSAPFAVPAPALRPHLPFPPSSSPPDHPP